VTRRTQRGEKGPTAGHGSKFGRKKEAAIAALLSQRNQEEAAQTAGVSKRTLNRWLGMPAFQAAYRDARRAAMSQANARLQQTASAAVSALLKVMVDLRTRIWTCGSLLWSGRRNWRRRPGNAEIHDAR
jgi:hypothetical protein